MKIGIIVGRFQTPYLTVSHRELIDAVVSKNFRTIVFVGSSDVVNTSRHPLSFLSVERMLEDYNKDLEVFSISDHPSDKYWSEVLDAKVRQAMVIPVAEVTLYGGRDSFIPYYFGDFPTKELEIGVEGESATTLRKSVGFPKTKEGREGMIYASQTRYPVVFSVVDAIIKDEKGRFLLGKKQGQTTWQFIGGFVDVTDDSLEDAVKREVKEETGLEVTPEFLFSLRIDEPRYERERDTMMTHVFMCKATKGKPIPMDDIEELKWFKASKLPELIDNHQKIKDQLDALSRS